MVTSSTEIFLFNPFQTFTKTDIPVPDVIDDSIEIDAWINSSFPEVWSTDEEEKLDIDIVDEGDDPTWTQAQKFSIMEYITQNTKSILDFEHVSKSLFSGLHDATSCHRMWKKLYGFDVKPNEHLEKKILTRKCIIGSLWTKVEVQKLLEAEKKYSDLEGRAKLTAIHEVLPERTVHAIKAKLKAINENEHYEFRSFSWTHEEEEQLTIINENFKTLKRTDKFLAIQQHLAELGIDKSITSIQTKLKAISDNEPDKYKTFIWTTEQEEQLLFLNQQHKTLKYPDKIKAIKQDLAVLGIDKTINSIQMKLREIVKKSSSDGVIEFETTFDPSAFINSDDPPKSEERKLSNRTRWLPGDDEELLLAAAKHKSLPTTLRLSTIIQDLTVKRSALAIEGRLFKLREKTKPSTMKS